MFPHNSSSHEISTDTNAFVQNSKRDVVVLEGSSLSGVEERKGPENAGYCDIKFINSSKTMAAPYDHPKTTAANDFSTVLLRHSSKLSSAVICLDGLTESDDKNQLKSRCATAITTASSNNNYIIYYNATNLSNAIHNNFNINNNNKNNNENAYRPRSGHLLQQQHQQQQQPTAVNNNNNYNSKSQLLSDNKDSFKKIIADGLLVGGDRNNKNNNNNNRVLSLKKKLQIFVVIDQQYNNNKKNNQQIKNFDNFDGFEVIISRIIITKTIPKSDEGSDFFRREIWAHLKLKANHIIIINNNSRRRVTYSSINKINNDNDYCNDKFNYKYDNDIYYYNYCKPKNNSESVILMTLGSASGLLLDNYNYYQIDDEDRDDVKKMMISSDFLGNEVLIAGCSSITLIVLLSNNNNYNSKNNFGDEPPRLLIINAVTEPARFSAPCVPMQKMTIGISCYYTEATICTVGALSLQDNDNKSNEPLKLLLLLLFRIISFKSVKTTTIMSPSSNNLQLNQNEIGDIPINYDDDKEEDVEDKTMTLSCQDEDENDNEENPQMTNNVPAMKKLLLDEFVKTRDLGVLERLKNLIKQGLTYVTKEDPYEGYKRRWGIADVLRGLAGGGESSLNNSGTANWASAQPTTPNNNSANNSGWGGTPGNSVGPSGGPANNWQQVSGGRNISGQNPNQNQGQGPPGGQNPGPNAQPGPPTSQPNNPGQSNQGNSQWPQQKPANPSVSGQSMPGPNNNTNNSMQQQQQSPQQAPQPSNSGANNNQMNNTGPGGIGTNANNPAASNNSSTKQQLEQLNTMREALFSPDGWGCNNINQDSNWDVPNSPEPNMCKDGMWKPPVNNGTDLWEANLRNGGQPPPQQQAKTPWGHTPSTNIGGTWGEDDDAADTSNMWTGAPGTNQPNTAQWPGPASGGGNAGATGGGPPGGNQTGMWSGGSNWGDPRVDPRDPRELRSMDPRESMRDPRDHRMSLDPNDHIRVIQPMGGRGASGATGGDPRAMSQGGGEMRGDPRGISGRLNGAGAAEAMWNQPQVGPPHHPMSQGQGHQQQQHPGAGSGPGAPGGKMLGATSAMNQWTGPPPKDMMTGGKPTGWEEPSPPSQRRNMPNYDDGTSLWGNPGGGGGGGGGNKPRGNMAPGNVSHWKDPSSNLNRGGGMQCPPGMMQNQMNPGQTGLKPDAGPMWTHPSGPAAHNGSWTEGPGPDATGGWNDSVNKSRNRRYPADMMNATGGKGLWDEHNKPPQLGGHGGNWGEADMDPTSSWGHAPKPALTKEIIWNSREFRYLCDLGFKKEDVEAALRSREMNRDEAQELLTQIRPVDQWRRHDIHSGYDPSNQPGSGQSFSRFNHVSQQMSFPPGVGVPGGAGSSVASTSLLKLQQQQQQQQAAVQLQQQQTSSNAPQPPFNQQQGSRTPQNPPSTQQLRMLVQQIQLAVQEGYLNHQILNQALAPQTLLLLNQLLQQIKVLQQLHQQHNVQNTIKGNSAAVLQISVQITKTKQQIANLQNQIAVQQATYMKQQQQQQQQQQHQNAPNQPTDYYKSNVHDPISALQNSFGELTMNKETPTNQQQSRLNQWKLPSLDKDVDGSVNDFSRAPGSSSIKPPTTPGGLGQSHSSPNMNPLLVPGEGTWSSRLGESGWPETGNNDSTDGKDWQPGGGVGGSAFTDLVPEFEPGKPWKGTQMKTIEDDPSITPGSVVRSPLSLAAIKDSDTIFSSGNKTSPPPQPMNESPSIPSLSNSTWSFNPPSTTPSAFASSKNTWGESAPPPTAVTSELWGAPMSKSGRGPPPGLGNKGSSAVSNASNGWSSLGRSNTWGLQGNAPNPGNAGWVSTSTWLLLRNLTPQIDGSTLKTLCMQHGPVQDFRLYLNHGIALAKYSSRDEAIKAQGALNNCVLGNTTIFAESPADNDVHTLLQQLSHGTGGAAGGPNPQQSPAGNSVTVGGVSGGWGAPRPKATPVGPGGGGTDAWVANSSQLFSANSLWSGTGLDAADQQRATPSSLNSYLPGDLLGGESM